MLGRVVKIFAKNTTRTNKWIPIKKEAWRFFAKPEGLELDNPIGLNVWHSPTFALFFIIRNMNLVVNLSVYFLLSLFTVDQQQVMVPTASGGKLAANSVVQRNGLRTMCSFSEPSCERS